MWLILVDRSASMGEQFAGFNGADRLPGGDNDRLSRVSVAVRQLAARGTGLHGAKLMFFTTPELSWPVVDVERTLVVEAPEPVGVTDVAGALDWAQAQVVPLEASIDVHVLLITDLRTTPDTSQLRTAADALLRKATVHLILMDPNYLTLGMASEIAPGRVLLAASLSGLASSLAGLFPGPPAIEAPPRLDAASSFEPGQQSGAPSFEAASAYATAPSFGAGSFDGAASFDAPSMFEAPSAIEAASTFGAAPQFDAPSQFEGTSSFGAPPRFDAPAAAAYSARATDGDPDGPDRVDGEDPGPDEADWSGVAWAAPEWTGENNDPGDSGREGGLVGRAMAIGRSMKRASSARLRK